MRRREIAWRACAGAEVLDLVRRGEKRGREGVAAIVRRQVDSAPRLFHLLGLNWTGLRMRAGRSASIGPSVRLKKMGSA